MRGTAAGAVPQDGGSLADGGIAHWRPGARLWAVSSLLAGLAAGAMLTIVATDSVEAEEPAPRVAYAVVLLACPLVTFWLTSLYRPILAFAGLTIGVLWAGSLSGISRPLSSGDTGVGDVSLGLVTVGLVISAALGLGARSATTRLRGRRTADGPPAARLISGIGGGALAIAAVALTGSLLAGTPAARSFDLRLPSGWQPIGNEWHSYVWLGRDFQAAIGLAGPPRADAAAAAAAVPLIGVSAIYASPRERTGSECLASMRAWEGPLRPQFLGDVVEWTQAEVSVAAGVAHEEAGPLRTGGRLYAFGLRRTRWVGLIPEPLCYAILVRVPDRFALTDADVEEIVAAFSFR